MDWMNLLTQIFEVCIIPLLGVLVAYFIQFLKTKSADIIEKSENDLVDKYVFMLTETISTCVIATKQTYVESLKKDELFDAEAQKKALQMTLDQVKSILTEEAKAYLAEAYGDLNAYIIQKIEAEVNLTK
jgi:hypothetical protein